MMAKDGNALIPALSIAVVLAGLGGTTLSLIMSRSSETRGTQANLQLRYLTEAGARLAVEDLRAGGDGVLGSEQAPRSIGEGTFWTTVTDLGASTRSVRCRATYDGREDEVECVVQSQVQLFHQAIAAFNSSEDPNYRLELGGTGHQADSIDGDVYSGGDLELSGDSTVTGDLRAYGVVDGATGEEGVTETGVDLNDLDLTTHVDVAGEFAALSSYEYDDAGGSADQVPETSPAHVFRRNPSDRSSETAATVKDDYFLEDPYENVRSDPNQNGSDAYRISLAGTQGEVGSGGNEVVYLIDGNLWIHNLRSYSLRFRSDASVGTKITIVVKGNIYISDNLFYGNKNNDGVALIAMEDGAVADSGNIYFGDSVFGTLERMEAFMFAENNFYDNNLSASGSSEVELTGVMSAGNHVAIDRDHGSSHTKLELNYDDRIKEGDLQLPGLPDGSSSQSLTVVGWLSQ